MICQSPIHRQSVELSPLQTKKKIRVCVQAVIQTRIIGAAISLRELSMMHMSLTKEATIYRFRLQIGDLNKRAKFDSFRSG